MKRIVTSAFALIIFSIACMAQNVSADNSRRAAVNFWNTHRTDANKSIAYSEPALYTFTEMSMLHIYAVGTEGFVIISAYDGVEPVMGYSFDSPATEEVNPEAAFWLRYLNDGISVAAASGYRTDEAASMWNTLLTAPVPPTPITLDDVPALLTTRWDQGNPYNKFCPYDERYHSRTVVGCVATAMAQVMKYWNHPSSGTGSHSYVHRAMNSAPSYGELSADFGASTYIWEYMNDRYESMIPSSERSEWAVALLSYHCGVAVDMMYGPSATGGSGAYSSCGGWTSACAEHAFYEYFKYSPDLEFRQRNGSIWYQGAYRETYYYSDSAWCAMIDSELEQRHPMYYSGSDETGGHAFVLDGKDLGRRYHFNWGWAGSYDGFYHINNVAPGAGGTGGNATYTFNRSQGAIFGIVPVEEQFEHVTINDTTCSGSPYRFHEYEFPSVNDTLQAIWLDTVYTIHLNVINQRTLHLIANGGEGSDRELSFCPHDGLVMPECPFIRPGYHFIGWGERRANCDTVYQPGDTLYWRSSKVVYAQWLDSSRLDIVTTDELEFNVYPQPTEGTVNIVLDNDDEATVTIVDIYGRVLTQKNTIGGRLKISLERMPAGTYTVLVATRQGVFKKQIIKL